MSLTKDKVVKMAREAGFSQDWQFAVPPATLSNFATLCRAPLVAEVERLKKDLSTVDVILEECKMDWSGDVTQIKAEHAHGLLALQADRDDWKTRAEAAEAELAWVRAVEPAGYFVPEGWDALGRVTDWAQVVKNQGTPLYATPPQPAAQEPDCAVHVVEQLVEALDGLFSGDVVVWSLGGSARPRAAIAAGQKFIKESGK